MIKNPVHPGVILKAEVLEPLNLSVSVAAERLGVSRVTLSRIINGHTGISADVAIRLEKAGAGGASSWLALQVAYDLAIARTHKVAHVELFGEVCLAG